MPIIGNIGPLELLLVLALALLILGPGKLPEVGAAFGKTIREFRKASTEVNEAVNPAAPAAPATPAQPTPAMPAPAAETTATASEASQSKPSGA
jgi:sec-independent protein translocase protein TatA